MAGSRRDIWKEILNRFDQDLVTCPAWRADRPDSPADKISKSLDRPADSPHKVLLSGTIGSGKSTELYRVVLTYGRLLPYPNKSVWYYPHPLLTLNRVKVP